MIDTEPPVDSAMRAEVPVGEDGPRMIPIRRWLMAVTILVLNLVDVIVTKAILRQHGRGLPEYDDGAESDVFLFSDADELVKVGSGVDAITGAAVTTYRARTEGGFARIERHELAGRSHFVVRTADDVLSIFGLEPEASIADPDDPTHVFQWLLQEQRDEVVRGEAEPRRTLYFRYCHPRRDPSAI